MYVTEFEEFYSWLIAQKAEGQWKKFSEYIDNRISVEREMIMTLLGSLSRENKEAINGLIECKAVINLLEELRDLPSQDVKQLAESAGVK